ncbi:MAG TPA: HAMP domain-containing sensor histidine kinase [Patescibacteria group bacterium]|nr:HAMP domain-containing sensor histidine kinase [Patescibacteria group bacterium]
MRAPTLVWQLTRVQILVVALACSLLVAGAMGASALLLRRDQDEALRNVATSICHAIAQERIHEEAPEGDMAPAREELNEAAMDGYRLELINGDGFALAAQGDLAGWSGELPGAPLAGGCGSVKLGGAWIAPLLYRACAQKCGSSQNVRVITLDILAEPGVRRAALGVFATLPLAVLVGGVAGMVVFRRLLRPLGALRRAAARLKPEPGVALGVGARPAELAGLEKAFDSLLRRLGETLAREKRFTQEASHELRTPLTMLRGRLEQLSGQLADRPVLKAEAEAALGDLVSLDRLVEALLVLARSESAGLPQTPVNICDLSRVVAARQAKTDGPSGGALEVDAPDEILVRGSEELLERAVGNLVENSRKYGGRDALIRIKVMQQDGRGVITVADNGPGIPPELRPFVFERFVRDASARNRVPGTGLGLAVVRAIALRHGGEVSTGPAAIGGEEVRLSLPLLT